MRVCRQHDVAINHVGRKLARDDLTRFDYVLGMDNANLDDIKRQAPAAGATARGESCFRAMPCGTVLERGTALMMRAPLLLAALVQWRSLGRTTRRASASSRTRTMAAYATLRKVRSKARRRGNPARARADMPPCWPLQSTNSVFARPRDCSVRLAFDATTVQYSILPFRKAGSSAFAAACGVV